MCLVDQKPVSKIHFFKMRSQVCQKLKTHLWVFKQIASFILWKCPFCKQVFPQKVVHLNLLIAMVVLFRTFGRGIARAMPVASTRRFKSIILIFFLEELWLTLLQKGQQNHSQCQNSKVKIFQQNSFLNGTVWFISPKYFCANCFQSNFLKMMLIQLFN